ncbi:MAG: hypothetical protein EA364_16090 [Balneolaceae bacterium]|jgi:hypothetical protein|nr:MAG: hypothetical protein EA364_16090 [Balneolaceae bacterium]
MCKKSVLLLLVITAVALSGCYHAKVSTGLTPSAEIHELPFAAGWIYGLVPPSEVRAAQHCTSGVAIVETRLSFLNQLVSGITFGIFTPMHIKVTCASSRADLSIPDYGSGNLLVERNASDEQIQSVFSTAGELTAVTGNPVFVEFY